MKQLISISVLSFLLWLNVTSTAKAQLVSEVSFDGIAMLISADSTSFFFYDNLQKRYSDAQQSLTMLDLEYKCLYYGYTFQKDYQPYKYEKMMRTFQRALEKGEHVTAQKVGQQIFESEPFNLQLIAQLRDSYTHTGQLMEAKAWERRYNMLIKTILSSGDGFSSSTAFVVNTGKDELAVLEYLGLEVETQTLVDYCEIIKVAQPNEQGIENLYFSIRKPLEKLERLVED